MQGSRLFAISGVREIKLTRLATDGNFKPFQGVSMLFGCCSTCSQRRALNRKRRATTLVV